MKRIGILIFASVISLHARPLGNALILRDAVHHKAVPLASLKQLPRRSTLRFAIYLPSVGTPSDLLLAYDRFPESSNETGGLLIVRTGKAIFHERAVFPTGQGWTNAVAVAGVSKIALAASQRGIALAIVNGATGAGTKVLVLERNDSYRIVHRQFVTQGELKIREQPSGTSLEIWNAKYSEECNGCPHIYEVSNHIWIGDQFKVLKTYRTRHKISPERFVGRELMLE